MERLVNVDDVIKAVDKHTNDDMSLDEDISIILEEVMEVKTMEKNEIIKALNVIKEVCAQCPDTCKDCPFYSDSSDVICRITRGMPTNWRIKEEEKEERWTAFK